MWTSCEKYNHRDINTDIDVEASYVEVRRVFAPQIVFINHEKRLHVDTVCSNLAIKYNLIYISVYQLLRHHIVNKTAHGLALLASKHER